MSLTCTANLYSRHGDIAEIKQSSISRGGYIDCGEISDKHVNI